MSSEGSLTLASYIGGAFPEAFVELTSVGAPLPDMPLFLSPEFYVQLPLEQTYESAWEAVPSFWRDVLTSDHQPEILISGTLLAGRYTDLEVLMSLRDFAAI